MTFHWFDGTCRGSSSCPSAVPCCCTYGWVTLRRKKQMQKHFLERNNTCHVKNIEKLDCERQKTNIILTLPSSDDAVESARSSLISAFVKCNPREVVTCRNNGGILCIFTALILWVRPDNLVPHSSIALLSTRSDRYRSTQLSP